MKYLETLNEFEKWQSKDPANRQVYAISCTKLIKSAFDIGEKTIVEDSILTAEDFELVCDYTYSLFLRENCDLEPLCIAVCTLLDVGRITLDDLQENSKDTEEIILYNTCGGEM